VTTQKILSHNSWYLAEFQSQSKSQRCYRLIRLAQSDEYKTTGNDINIIFSYLCHISCLYLRKIPRNFRCGNNVFLTLCSYNVSVNFNSVVQINFPEKSLITKVYKQPLDCRILGKIYIKHCKSTC